MTATVILRVLPTVAPCTDDEVNAGLLTMLQKTATTLQRKNTPEGHVNYDSAPFAFSENVSARNASIIIESNRLCRVIR